MSAIPDGALRGLDEAVCAILASRHPGTRWKPERLEGDAPAARALLNAAMNDCDATSALFKCESIIAVQARSG